MVEAEAVGTMRMMMKRTIVWICRILPLSEITTSIKAYLSSMKLRLTVMLRERQYSEGMASGRYFGWR